MTLRTGFSRIFAVLFSLIGAPLVLLLTISGAFTIREGVGKAWAWRCGHRKQGRVADGRGHVGEGRAGQYGSGRGGSAVSTLNLASRPQSSTSAGAGVGGVEHGARVTPNGPGELPGSLVPPSSTSGRSADIQQQARVPALDSTLRSSSALSSTPRDTDESSASSAASNSISGGALNSSQYRTTRADQPYSGVNPVLQRRGKLGYPPYARQVSRRGHAAPWAVYLAILVAYVLLGLAIFAPIQRWSLPSSLYILLSTLLTLDHDSLGEKELLGSSKIIVPYVLYMLVGLVLVATLVISVWSNLCTSLVNTGKYLAVVRPAAR